MIKAIKNKHQFDEQNVLDIKRMRVPNSARLQNNILNLTQELPQYTDQPVGAQIYNLTSLLNKVGIRKINFWNGLTPYAATLAAGLAAIALSSSLWLPSQHDQLAVDNLEGLSVEQLAEEIEWQDLMLLQDELGFAGL